MQMVSGFHSVTVQGCCILVSGHDIASVSERVHTRYFTTEPSSACRKSILSVRSCPKNVLIPSGDSGTSLCYNISGPDTGIGVCCQNIQQHQGSFERRVSYADKNVNIFLRNSSWRFYRSSPGQRVYLSVPHSKVGQAHLITQWRRNCGGGGWGGIYPVNITRSQINCSLIV